MMRVLEARRSSVERVRAGMSGYIHDACGVDDGCDACGALRVTPPCVASPCVALRFSCAGC